MAKRKKSKKRTTKTERILLEATSVENRMEAQIDRSAFITSFGERVVPPVDSMDAYDGCASSY